MQAASLEPQAKMTFFNSKLDSYAVGSRLGDTNALMNSTDDDNMKLMAIMHNRMTQFDTLVIPGYLEEIVREERKTMKNLTPEEKKIRINKLAKL